jgi:hypothetical protein
MVIAFSQEYLKKKETIGKIYIFCCFDCTAIKRKILIKINS